VTTLTGSRRRPSRPKKKPFDRWGNKTVDKEFQKPSKAIYERETSADGRLDGSLKGKRSKKSNQSLTKVREGIETCVVGSWESGEYVKTVG